MEFIEKPALILCLVSIAGYLTAGILFIKKKKKAASIAAVLGWSSNLGIFIKNWIINGYAPFASMYQVLSVLSLAFLIIYMTIIFYEKDERRPAPYFCFGAAVPLIGTLFMDKQIRWSLMPALQSGWFVPHVCSYVLSYAPAAVAFVLTIVFYLRKDRPQKYEKAVYTVLRFSFPFMTTGLMFGALWADQVWGNFWQWDVKEIWSLVTMLFYLCYFHARRHSKTRQVALLFTFLGFAALIVTFLFVNVLPKAADSFHTYT